MSKLSIMTFYIGLLSFLTWQGYEESKKQKTISELMYLTNNVARNEEYSREYITAIDQNLRELSKIISVSPEKAKFIRETCIEVGLSPAEFVLRLSLRTPDILTTVKEMNDPNLSATYKFLLVNGFLDPIYSDKNGIRENKKDVIDALLKIIDLRVTNPKLKKALQEIKLRYETISPRQKLRVNSKPEKIEKPKIERFNLKGKVAEAKQRQKMFRSVRRI